MLLGLLGFIRWVIMALYCHDSLAMFMKLGRLHYRLSRDKARKICRRFNINPLWEAKKFNHEEEATVRELYGIFFDGIFEEFAPYFRLTTTMQTNLFRFDLIKYDKPDHLKLVGPSTYTLLGESIDVGHVAYEMTDTLVARPGAKRRKRPKTYNGASADSIPVTFQGTATSRRIARVAPASA